MAERMDGKRAVVERGDNKQVDVVSTDNECAALNAMVMPIFWWLQPI